MKSLAIALLVSAANAAAVQAGPELPYYMGTPVDTARLQPRQNLGDLLGGGISAIMGGAINAGGGGKVPDPAGAAPRKAVLQPRVNTPGAKTVKVRYGPYRIPDVNKINGPSGHGGTIYNLPDVNVDMPCKDCTLIGFEAGLELPDGTNANINSGLWLHHYVHFVVGAGRTDATCGGSFSLPHMLIGATSTTSERFFSSGNERTKFNTLVWGNNTGPNAGYYLRNSDKMALIIDLMNENTVEKTVYVTVTYDYIDGQPQGYDDLRIVWFDVNQCSTSEVSPPKQNGNFVISSQPWKANFEGEIMGWIGHLHDGGSHINMEVDGKSICTSGAQYGETAEYVSPEGAHGHALAARDGGMKHISSMKVCMRNDNGVKLLKKNQSWVLRGYYDYDKYPGSMGHNGKQDSIMGISIMYVRVPRGTATNGVARTVAEKPSVGGILADLLAGVSGN